MELFGVAAVLQGLGQHRVVLEQLAGDAVFGAAGKVSAQVEGLPFAGQRGKILAGDGLGQQFVNTAPFGAAVGLASGRHGKLLHFRSQT